MTQFKVIKPKAVKPTDGIVVTLISDAGGTHLQGYIEARYADIRKILGNPNCEGDGYKVTTEWNIQFKEPDGTRTVATIYDWKEGGLRCRRGEYNWHVGGFSPRAVELVQQLLAS